MHCHVGLVGDRWPHWGGMSDEYRKELTYQIFLLYARIDKDDVCDQRLREKVIETIATSNLDKVVCLALDPVYTETGTRNEGASHLWVDNDFILELRRELPDKILLGASVHPFDKNFEDRVRKYVDEGAVLLKWLPSAQQFNLASDQVRRTMEFLGTAGPGGKPLPLLLHIGPEYAVPTSDKRTQSYDFLTWSFWDDFGNFFRSRRKKWRRPDIQKIRQNIESALAQGTDVIFAHCGLPYFSGGILGGLLEHSEFKAVREWLQRTDRGEFKGRCFADVSAVTTPFRKKYFSDLRKIPQDLLLYGSDFPTPTFELSADLGEMYEDFKAILKGKLYRIIIPQDNLLDVNLRELRNAFPGSPCFTNFARHGFVRNHTP
jgi:predicted TIM-barrel fold metal-dependent hydrolase